MRKLLTPYPLHDSYSTQLKIPHLSSPCSKPTPFRAHSRQPLSHKSARRSTHLTVHAASSVASDRPTSTDGAVFDRTYPLNGSSSLQVTVTEGPNAEQIISVSTSKPGKFLLHWGVEGGKGYKGGWRLPGDSCRPSGTIAYKNRALRTPFRSQNGNGLMEVRLTLAGDERSDYLDFVLKDETTDTWYDFNGSNYQVPLRRELASAADDYVSSESEDDEEQVLLPLSAIPALPQDLSGVWAYMKWEHAGCPNRSKEEADHEYQNALDELIMLLRRGASIEELKGVAAAGVGRYSDYIASHQARLTFKKKEKPAKAVSAPPPPPPPPVVEEKQAPVAAAAEIVTEPEAPQEPQLEIPEALVRLLFQQMDILVTASISSYTFFK